MRLDGNTNVGAHEASWGCRCRRTNPRNTSVLGPPEHRCGRPVQASRLTLRARTPRHMETAVPRCPALVWRESWPPPTAHPGSQGCRAGRPRRDQGAEMRSHSGSQDLGRPKVRRAFEGDHLAKPQRRCRTQDAARRSRRPGRGPARPWRDQTAASAARGMSTRKPSAGAGPQRAEPVEQTIGYAGDARRPVRQVSQGRPLPGALADDGLAGGTPASSCGIAEVFAFDPYGAVVPVVGALTRQPPHSHQQRIVARRDVLERVGAQTSRRRAHEDPPMPSAARTGAKVLRCAGHAPCALSAARCAGVGYPLCAAKPYAGWCSCSAASKASR
jgi:hypothetical protein